MARKSQAEKLTATVRPIGKLPPPPTRLSDYEASLWDAIVKTKPADWFQADTLPLLEAYVGHVATAQMLDRLIRDIDPETIAKEESAAKRFERFTRRREAESRAALAMARSMRLTHQAQYDEAQARRRAKGAKGGRPWDTEK